MRNSWIYSYSILALLTVHQPFFLKTVLAQPILPATDGTQTQVIPNGNQFNIQGGQLSRDGANLFHSFQRFGVPEGQTANFLSNPQIQNILGRINGGEPSLINGLIQVTGGYSNLYLMNPAGIVFGTSAQLNVPGSFFATTATGIGFAGEQWFNAMGNADWANLQGTPSQFAFSGVNPAAIINAGYLKVPEGQTLALLGGTVMTLGTLEAPGGNITIAAIPGEQVVRFSQAGHLLNLEISPQPLGENGITPVSLPQLLTNSEIRHATGLSVNEAGQVVLGGSGLSVPVLPGTSITQGTVNVSSNRQGGSINLLGNQVGLFGATVNADGATTGGTVRIGGDFQGLRTLPTAQQTWVSRDSAISANALTGFGGRVIVWSDRQTRFLGNLRAIGETGGFVEISGKESLIFRGNVDVRGTEGIFGTILFDPKNIEIANSGNDDLEGNTAFSDNAGGNVTFNANQIGDLTGNVILEANNDITVSDPIVSSSINNLELIAGRSININADIDTSAGDGNITLIGNDDTASLSSRDSGPANISQAPGTILASGNGDIGIGLGTLGEVGTIRLGDILTAGGNITVVTEGSIDLTGNLVTATDGSQAGNIQLSAIAGSITTTPGQVIVAVDLSEQGRGGNITLEAFGDIITGQVVSQGGEASGDILIRSNNGQINTTAIDADAYLDEEYANIDAFSPLGRGGNITLEAFGDITTGQIVSQGSIASGNIDIFSATGNINAIAIDNLMPTFANLNSVSESGPGGSIRLEANRGSVTTGDITSESLSVSDDSEGVGGNIQVSAENDISVGNLSSTGLNVSGDITLFSLLGEIVSGTVTSSSPEGQAGTIDLDASAGVIVGEILSEGKFSGGDIRVFSEAGQIILNGRISSVSESGTGGDILIDSFDGDITTVGDISSQGLSQGGNITFRTDTGGIDTREGGLDSFSEEGKAGDVTLEAQGDILTQAISSEGWTQGGRITISSSKGQIDTAAGSLDSFSDLGTAGNVTLSAFRDITTADINTFAGNQSLAEGEVQGGNLTLSSTQGGIDTSAGELAAFAWEGNAGNVSLEAQGDVQTGFIGAYTLGQGNFQGGNIRIISREGAIATTVGDLSEEAQIAFDANVASEAIASVFREENANLDTYSLTGRGGNVFLQAQRGIATSHISSFGAIDAGSVTLSTQQEDIQTGVLFSFAETGTGGAIAVDAIQGNIGIQHIATYSPAGIGGEVRLNAFGNLALNNVASFGNLASGDVSIRSQSITTGAIQTLAPTGTSGNISLNTLPNISGDIRTANITSAGGTGAGNIRIVAPDGSIITGDVTSDGGSGRGGDISLDAKNSITAGNVTSTGQLGGGEVTLNSETGTVSTGEITIGNTAVGGVSAVEAIASIEESRNTEFTNYFGSEINNSTFTTASAREALKQIAETTGVQSAVVYVTLDSNQIELVIFTAEGQPIRKVVPQVDRQQVLDTAKKFYFEITDPRRRFFETYLPLSQQLYQWLIAPIEAELQAASIDTLLFSMDGGLRSLPIAALHDGEQFLIEKYSLSMIPSLSLMDTRYQSLSNARILAMGASEFISLPPLLAVPLELSTITGEVWQGQTFLNAEFTQENLIEQRQAFPYPIIHLATHADFRPGKLNESYIQLWGDAKITLDRLRQLGFDNPPVELLVLSACRTAFGDEQAELGFAGLAIQAGAKSALASLWYVSDEGTLALMSEFYNQLSQAKIKAEGLRQAQLVMLKGNIAIQDGQLRRSGTRGDISLPPELTEVENQNLSHPYYWSGFTLIGSPW